MGRAYMNGCLSVSGRVYFVLFSVGYMNILYHGTTREWGYVWLYAWMYVRVYVRV